MTDSPRPGPPYNGPGSPYDGPTEQFPNSYPAYAGYPPPGYQNPTQELPGDWAYATQQPHQPPPPPQPPTSPKSPKWLWFAAGAAIVLVVGLVGALILTSGSSSDTDQATGLTATEPTATAPSRTSTAPSTPSTTSRTPSPSASAPVIPSTTPSGASESIGYQVTGEGVALTITYIDADGVLQILYNVTLPWSADVTLESPASEAASVVVVNVGREVTCSITVNGEVESTATNSGLTTCSRLR